MSFLKAFPLPPRLRKWLLVLAAVFLIPVIGLWAGKGWIVAKIEGSVRERLAARGLTAEWRDASWKLWRGGVVFDEFVLRDAAGERKPVAEMERLAVRMPLWELLTPGPRAMIWRIPRSRVVLTDAEGSIVLEEVSARFETHRGKILVKEAEARAGGLTVDLEGEITTRKEPLSPPPKFVMRLRAVRGTLAALDFSGDGGRFLVKGTFTVDASNPSFDWTAQLKGHGKDVIWKKVKFEKAGAKAELSSTSDSLINAGVATEHGKARAVITRKDWKGSPFGFEGTLEDEAKRVDRYQGEYEKGSFRVDRLEGDADLWAMASAVPAMDNDRPSALEFRYFPPIEAEGIRWRRDEGWTVAAARTKGEGVAVIKQDDKEIEIKGLTGAASLGGKTWQLKDVRGELFGGSLAVSGSYSGGQLSKSSVKGENLRLAQIKQAVSKGKPSKTPGILSVNYSGAVRFQEREFDGEGTIRMEKAPVIEVPLLDQVHDLFAAVIPGVERSKSGEGRFDANFTSRGSVVRVGHFEATGGTLVVDARGAVDLKDQSVSGSARGKLTGLPGVVTSPLSRLLEMEVGGTIDRLRVERLRPGKMISNAATGTADVVKDVVKGTGEAGKGVRGKSPRSPSRWFDKWRKDR